VLRLSRCTELREVPGYTERFPAERKADVTCVMRDGRILERHEAACPGDPSRPMSDEQLAAKFRALAGPVMTEAAASLERTISALTADDNSRQLSELLLNPMPTVHA